MSEAVELHAYDPAWPALFERERTLLAPILGPNATRIEHMGSTSIPGLPAKPVIDIIVLVTDLEAARQAIPPSKRPATASGRTIPTNRSSTWQRVCRRRRAGPTTSTSMTIRMKYAAT